MSAASALTKLKVFFFKKHPFLKGMVAYSVLWPTGSLIQQTLQGKNFETYDWAQCLRYGVFGTFFVAPSLYGWVRFTSVMWPKTNLRSGIAKAVVDQLSYGPFSMVSFYIGMSLFEMKSLDEAVKELKQKFLPTWKVAICYWPFIQTINFSLIRERNRVVFVSLCSVIWTTFLAYMKQLEQEDIEKNEEKHHIYHNKTLTNQ